MQKAESVSISMGSAARQFAVIQVPRQIRRSFVGIVKDRNFILKAESDKEKAMSTSRRVSITMLLGALALWASFQWWAETRKLVPLDLPVSLSRGHIRTEPFSINLRSGYNVEFLLVQAAALYNLEGQNAEQFHKSLAMLQTHWVLSSDGKEVTSGAIEGTNATGGDKAVLSWPIGLFGSSGRQFRIDAEILSDTGVLNRGDPHLVVQVDRNGDDWFSELSQIVPIIAGIFGAVGVALLWASRRP